MLTTVKATLFPGEDIISRLDQAYNDVNGEQFPGCLQ